MTSFTREKLSRIINDHEFSELVGEFENSWFECKGVPYQLDKAIPKATLAKQVAALANSEGGYILFGLISDKDELHSGDKVVEVRPIPVDQFNQDQIEKLLDAWIYPRISGLRVRWMPNASGDNKGIGVIEIPHQADGAKPFLYKVVNEDGKVSEILFGYAERIRDASQRVTIERLHTALQQGLNMSGTLEMILSKVNDLSNPEPVAMTLEDVQTAQSNRQKKNLDKSGLTGLRSISLIGAFKSKDGFGTFTQPEVIVNSLSQLPERGMRSGGWKLINSSQLEENSIDVIRTQRSDVRVLELFADGMVIWTANLNYLCFLSGELLGSPPRIVPIALVEVVYQFVEYYFWYCTTLEYPSDKVLITIDLANMKINGVSTELPSHAALPNQHYSVNDAPENATQIIVEVSTTSPSIAAFQVLTKIYDWFGFPDTVIPYTNETKNAIDKAKLQK